MTLLQTVFTERPGSIRFAIWAHYLRTGGWPKALLVPDLTRTAVLFEGVTFLHVQVLGTGARLLTFPFYGHEPGYQLVVQVPPISLSQAPLTRCRLVDEVPQWP